MHGFTKQYLDPAQDIAQVPLWERRCRECGCSDMEACVIDGDPCYWVAEDLCSDCMPSSTHALYGHEHPTTMEHTEQRIAHVVHDLKIWPTFFDAVRDGIKPFEVRKNHRHFRVGDVLQLQEWSPSTGEFTGRTLQRVVVYILAGGQFGVEEGYVVLGFDGPAQSIWHHNALLQFSMWLAKMDVLKGFGSCDGWPVITEEQALRVLRVAVKEYCEDNRIPCP